jgi:hypothetical protein
MRSFRTSRVKPRDQGGMPVQVMFEKLSDDIDSEIQLRAAIIDI